MRSMGAWRRRIFRFSEWVYACSTGIAVAEGYILSLQPSQEIGYFHDHPVQAILIKSLQDWAIPIFALCGVLVVACFVVQRFGDPWVLDKIQFILDGYRSKCFAQFDGNRDPHDNHRVTLFKLERRLNPNWKIKCLFKNERPLICKYLVPMLRSGHMSQNSDARFYVCDQSAENEGLAGLAWSMNSHIVKDQLPDLTSLYSGRRVARQISDPLVAGYSAETNCSIEMINSYVTRKRHLPRAIGATTVMVRDKLWGVLVVDSRRPDGVSLDSISNYTLTVSVIGELLERA